MIGVGYSQEKDPQTRLWWLMFYRVLIISFLLGIATFIQFKLEGSLSQVFPGSIYNIVGITYLLSIFYALLSKTIKRIDINVYMQCLLDVALITIVVYLTGGISSDYSSLYFLVIIYSVIFLGVRGGLLVASAGGILYGLLLDLEYYGYLYPPHHVGYTYDFSAGYVFSRIFVHIVLFYAVGLLVSFVVNQEKKAKILLKEKESAFDRLDSLYRSIIESVSAGILTIDLGGKIKSFNRAAEDISGFSFDQVKNKSVDCVFPSISKMLVESKEEHKRFEADFSSENGWNKILGFSFSSLDDPEEKSIGKVLIFQDLTSAKKMEKDVEKNKRLAIIGELAAALAHELRNPLASISGSVRLLDKDLKLEGTDKKLMEIILRGREQLENLIRDFLLLARPGSEDCNVMDVGEIIDDILESIRFGADWNENVRIMKKLCDRNKVYGNRTEIRQAILNVVLNAFQSMPEGGSLKIETEMTENEDGNSLFKISICDTGYGIEKLRLLKVKEPFYTTREKGTGLGLAIVNRIVESHKGRFDIESEPDKGTKCTISLPAGPFETDPAKIAL